LEIGDNVEDRVFERIQSLSKKEFALGGPMDIGPRMSDNTIYADLYEIHESSGLSSTEHM
jgi:hypothetical protein